MNTPEQTIQLLQFSYGQTSAKQTARADALVRYVWQMDATDAIHGNTFTVMSFCATAHEQLVGYVGVACWPLRLWQGDFRACALSCVCTHPKFRGRGIGTRLVVEATRWIRASPLDVGLFTCLPQYSPFYERAGWPQEATLRLRGNAMSNEFDSAAMGLAVHRLLLTAKAERHAEIFTGRVLTLNLPRGQFV